MGGVVGKVALVVLGAVIGAAAVEHAQKAARAAAEAVFEAIIDAGEAASSFLSALYRAASSAAAEAYEEVKRVVAQACDAVKRAAACVSSRVVELVERVHGILAAGFAKSKLDGVNELVGVVDVASLVAFIIDGIKGLSSSLSDQPFGLFVPSESPKGRRAASSITKIMELLGMIFNTSGKLLDLNVPTVAKGAIIVVGAAAQLVFSFLLP